MKGYKTTEEEILWLKNNCRRYDKLQQLTDAYNEYFNTNKSLNAINKMCTNKLNYYISDNIFYSKEEKEWIINNFNNYSFLKDLAVDFNKIFNVKRSEDSLGHKCSQLGLKFRYDINKEKKDWLLNNVSNYSTYKELTAAYNKKFGVNVGKDSVYKMIDKRNRYVSKKYKVGDEKYTNDRHQDVVYIKQANGTFKRKDRIIWEQYYPNKKLPTNTCLIHLDGDFMNCNIDNLYPATSNATLHTLNKYHILEQHNKYLTLCVLKIIEHNILIKNKDKSLRIKLEDYLGDKDEQRNQRYING